MTDDAGALGFEINRWDCSQTFVVTRGELGLEAESALYKQGVRREIHPGRFRWACLVEASHLLVAQAEAFIRLRRLVEPYGVTVFAFDMRVVAVPSQPYVTRSGKVLSDADIEKLSEEAEEGYGAASPG